MYFFLIIPFALLAYLFFCIRRTASKKRGSILALVLLSATLLSFIFRTSAIGFACQAVLVVWIAEALTLFLCYDIFRLQRFIVNRPKIKKALHVKLEPGYPLKIKRESRMVLIASFVLTAIFLAYGIPHNQNFAVQNGTVKLNEKNTEPFDVLFFSDLHIDPLFQKSKIERLISIADSIKPNFIIFGGDLADVTDAAMTSEGYDALFSKLTNIAKSYGVVGNHEAYMELNGSNPENWMEKNGMTVLSDRSECNDKMCISGRVDFQVARTRDEPRKPLQDFSIDAICKADSANCQKPWILVDHQPKGIEKEYSGSMPTIALSGHTHDGQFFPVTVFIDLVWRIAYGFGELDGSKWLVTSGIDTWGPPVRVGSNAEIWHLKFE